MPASSGNDYVALAFSPTTGGIGWGTGSSQDEATQIAIAQCVANFNSVCEVVATMHNGCAAYALDAVAVAAAVGTGADAASASADALSTLPGGEVVTVQCSRP